MISTSLVCGILTIDVEYLGNTYSIALDVSPINVLSLSEFETYIIKNPPVYDLHCNTLTATFSVTICDTTKCIPITLMMNSDNVNNRLNVIEKHVSKFIEHDNGINISINLSESNIISDIKYTKINKLTITLLYNTSHDELLKLNIKSLIELFNRSRIKHVIISMGSEVLPLLDQYIIEIFSKIVQHPYVQILQILHLPNSICNDTHNKIVEMVNTNPNIHTVYYNHATGVNVGFKYVLHLTTNHINVVEYTVGYNRLQSLELLSTGTIVYISHIKQRISNCTSLRKLTLSDSKYMWYFLGCENLDNISC